MEIHRKKYMKFYQDFNNLCVKFEQVPDIEFEKSPSQYPSIKSPHLYNGPQSPKLKFIISELKRRVRSCSNKSPISIKVNRLKIQTQTEEKIGPGSYLTRSSEKPEVHQFSTIPRLKTPMTHTLLNIESLYGNGSKEFKSKQIILNNKNLASDSKIISVKRQSYFDYEKNKEDAIKERKKIIDLKNKEIKKEKFDRKTYLFELRMMKMKIVDMQKAWVLFFIVCTVGNKLRFKARIKKVLRSRWEVLLRRFVVISKCLARIIMRLKSIRRRILTRNLNYFYLPFGDFLRNCILEKKKKLQIIIIEYSELPTISRLMVKVKFSIMKLQRYIRSFLTIKKSRVLALRIMWEKLYNDNLNSKSDKSISRIGIINKKTINMYTSKYIYRVIISYLNRVQEYNEKLIESNDSVHSLSLKKPSFMLYTHKEPLARIVEQAIRAKDSMLRKQRYQKYTKMPISKSP
jgi:hypothetical protein